MRFFFLHEGSPYALVSLYGKRNEFLRTYSLGALWACKYRGDRSLCVIPATSLLSVVSMQKLPLLPTESDTITNYWFVIEKSGLDISVDEPVVNENGE